MSTKIFRIYIQESIKPKAFKNRKLPLFVNNCNYLGPDHLESIILESPAILTSADDFIRSNEIVRTKWPIYQVIGHFVLTI